MRLLVLKITFVSYSVQENCYYIFMAHRIITGGC